MKLNVYFGLPSCTVPMMQEFLQRCYNGTERLVWSERDGKDVELVVHFSMSLPLEFLRYMP